MSEPLLLTVDRERCARDGICVKECPFGILQEDAEGWPEARRAGDRLCIHCGHCVAVCPKAALSLDGADAASYMAVSRKDWPAPHKLENLLKGRRSIRAYKPEPLSEADIETLLEVARYAPSAVNIQPVHWAASLDPARTRELAGMAVDWMRSQPDLPYKGWIAAWDQGQDKVLHGAPHVVLAHSPDSARWGLVDCTTALAWLEIQAAASGFGTCWAGLFTRAAQQWEPLAEALNLPEGHRVQGAVMLGRPAVRYARIPQRLPLRLTWL